MGNDANPQPETQRVVAYEFLRHVIDVRPEELRALGWSWLYIISLFVSYYILRPIRDEMGVAGGIENLPWLFTGTLLGMIAVNPPFAALVKTLPRVAAEMALHVLAYNLTRVMNIIGIKPLIAAIRA